jgi:hypothetical protein
LAVVERANPRDQVHAVHALEPIPHEHGVVVSAAAEVFRRAVAVAVPGRAPVVTGEDLGEQVRDAFVAVRDEDRLYEASSTGFEQRCSKVLRAFLIAMLVHRHLLQPCHRLRPEVRALALRAAQVSAPSSTANASASISRSVGTGVLVHGQRMRTRATGVRVPPLGTPDAGRPHEGTTLVIAS